MIPVQIAHYRITSKIGEGGMGAVYRATDTKLNRDVAIKVLPESFAGDSDRLARFTREAQVLASLNHPNIAQIYGVEDRALVMELVEGSEPRGPLDAEAALPLIHQLVDALEYAHEKGIVHRDLKPANLKITPQGNLKVLDFGLAKAMTGDPASAAAADPANSPTLTMRATMAGAIMGTAAYMSPEQARGQNVDKRADIWSFGVVVYELLTGTQLISGATVSDMLAGVLRQDLDLTPVPARFRRLLRACLERDVRRRMRDIGDARLLLLEDAQPVVAAPAAKAGAAWKVATAVSAIAAIVLAAVLWRSAGRPDRPILRFNAELAPDAVASRQMSAAISPDGTRVAFRVRGPNGYALATRRLDEAQTTLLPGTEQAYFAFFSPDGQWLGFFSGDHLKKVPVQGGAPVTICRAPAAYGATWMGDGTIVAVVWEWSLIRVPAAGGEPQPFVNSGNLIRRFPQALPGGENVLVTSGPQGLLNYDNANVDVLSLKTGEQKTVVRGAYFGRYLPSGHLIYVRQGTLYAVAFDLAAGETRGNPVPVLEDFSGAPGWGAGRFDVSLNGTLVYSSGKPLPAEQPLAVMDAAGKQTLLNGASGTCLRLSPDGKRLAYAAAGDLSVYDLQSETPVRVTFDPAGSNRHPTWTPDGNYLAYAGSGGIWFTRADGSGQPVRIVEGNPSPTPWSFTAGDGPHQLRLAFHRPAKDATLRDAWVLPLDLTNPGRPAPGKPELFLGESDNETAPAFSPDGRWLAYDLNSAETQQIFVRRYRPGMPAGEGGKWQITDAVGGDFAVWSSGKLFYRSANAHIMVVDYTVSGDAFSPGRPREWAPTRIAMTGVFQNFDMFPDGKRAVVVALDDDRRSDAAGSHATFLLNFFDEIKRKLP